MKKKAPFKKMEQTQEKDHKKGVQCYECSGFGHIATECANLKKKKRGKAMAVTWSDSDDLEEEDKSSDDDEDQVANFIAFSSSHNSNEVVSDKEEEEDKQEESDSNGESNSSSSNFEFDEEMDYDDFMRFFHNSRSKKKKEIQKLKEEKLELTSKVTHLSKEMSKAKELEEGLKMELVLAKKNEESLRKELMEARGLMAKMTSGTEKLDKMLSCGKSPCDKKGLGYVEEVEATPLKKTTFVKSKEVESSQTPQHSTKWVEVGESSKQAQARIPTRAPPQARAPQARPPQPRPPQARAPPQARPPQPRPPQQRIPQAQYGVFHAQPRRHVNLAQHQRRELPQHPRATQNRRRPQMLAQGYGMNPYFSPTCHFCGIEGHIRPNCFKYINLCRRESMIEKNMLRRATMHAPRKFRDIGPMAPRNNYVSPRLNRNDEYYCYVAQVALKANASNTWYLDSGCSRHMTGNKSFFKTLVMEDGGFVTFGDGSKKKVIGKGNISIPGLPSLPNALYVDGLQANLISISHLSDEGLSVMFGKVDCSILKENGQVLLKGKRSSDNCYCLESNLISCNLSTSEQVEVWHQRLGHMNYRDLKVLDRLNVVRGLPKLGKKVEGVCGPCQQGKQTKSVHKKGKYLSTKEPLELLHMDLMGPIQTESLGGRRYILVVVDDFSRFTWTYFLREKSEAFEKFKMLCVKIQNEKTSHIKSIKKIRSDHGKEFENASFEKFCNSLGISHEFSAPRTPQQNGVVKRKNHVLQEIARVMLNTKKVPRNL